MPKHELSSRHFQRKISEYCEVAYSTDILKAGAGDCPSLPDQPDHLPQAAADPDRRIDWASIGVAYGLEDEMTAELKKRLRPALDAIIRWLKAPPVAEDVRPAKQSTSTSKTGAV